MKEKIREDYLMKRSEQNDEELEEKSSKIKEKLFSINEYKKAKTIMLYCSFGNEVKTESIIKEMIEEKRVVVPKIIQNKQMEPIEISKTTLFKKNDLEISEPIDGKTIDKNEIDIIIIPAVAFDFIGHRIGYGQGYYDRFLEGMGAKKIGVAFDFQLTKEIPAEAHDVKVDAVITDKRVLKYN